MKALVIATFGLLGSVSAMAAGADPQALIRQGEYLARAGDCVACHTAKDGKPFAGGLPMETPIGTIYSTNITPDKSGIGDYSFDAPLTEGDKLLLGDMAIYTTCKNNTFNGMPLPDIWALQEDGTLRQLAHFGYGNFKQRLGSCR